MLRLKNCQFGGLGWGGHLLEGYEYFYLGNSTGQGGKTGSASDAEEMCYPTVLALEDDGMTVRSFG